MASASHTCVLLVDDEPLVRIVACAGLTDAGFDVVEAVDAEDAIRILRTRDDIAVLFTDVNMPGRLDGLGLAELVHRNWPSIKLVVTSGRTLSDPVPDDGRFLGKPYTLEKMTSLIAEVSGAASDR